MKQAIDRINKTFNEGDYLLTEEYCHAFLQQHDHIYVRYVLSMAKLHNQDLLGGLNYYKARWSSPQMTGLFDQLLRYGTYIDTWEDIQGRSMILTGEQGFGDELLFSRVIPYVCKKVAKLLVISSKEVQSLLQHNYPTIEFIGMGEPLNHRKHEFDSIATVADMFRAYALYYKEIPPVPHYTIDHKIHMVEDSDKKKAAIVYRAGDAADNQAERSIPASAFENLAKKFDLYSFQVPSEQLTFTKDNLGNNFKSFMDTARFLAGMDIAISCDTAFTHLALNMRKPTYLVYDKYLDWRWKNNIYSDVNVINYEICFKSEAITL